MLRPIYDNILPQEVQKSVSLLSKHLWIAAKRRGDEDFWNWGCIIMCYLVFYNHTKDALAAQALKIGASTTEDNRVRHCSGTLSIFKSQAQNFVDNCDTETSTRNRKLVFKTSPGFLKKNNLRKKFK